MECTWQLWDSVERGTWSIRFYFTHKVKKDTFGPKRHGTCFLKLLRVRTRNLFGRQSLTASVRPQVCPVLKRKAQYRLWAAVRQRALVQRSCQTFLCKRWPPRALQEKKSVTSEKVFFFPLSKFALFSRVSQRQPCSSRSACALSPTTAPQQGAAGRHSHCPTPRSGPSPIKCLRWHDCRPKKCPHIQRGHAAGTVFGSAAITVQWGSGWEWTPQTVIVPAEVKERGGAEDVGVLSKKKKRKENYFINYDDVIGFMLLFINS